MDEFLSKLLIAVITAAVPVLTTFVIAFINKLKAQAVEQTEDAKRQNYIKEIADAVSVAVGATSQTYVDALKNSGSFTVEAQKEAAQKALAACIASISPAAQTFITSAYGDLTAYLMNRIEAEVRKQKPKPSDTASTAALESTSVAASTAAATAASIVQTAIQQNGTAQAVS